MLWTPLECHTWGGSFKDNYNSDPNMQYSNYIIFGYMPLCEHGYIHDSLTE